MPSKPTAKRPHSSPHLREEAVQLSTPKHTQPESPFPFRPVVHVREQGPSTKARFKRRTTHQNYSGFHPKPAKPKRTASEEQLATALSEQLQANIQAAANQFSAQLVHSTNELANTAADAVGSDIQSAAGAISDAVAKTSKNIETNIEGTVAQLGTDLEGQVAKYLTPKNIERAAIRIVHNLAHVAIGAQHLIMSSDHPNDQDERDNEEDPLLPGKKKPRTSRNFVNVEHWNDPGSKRHALQTTRDKVKDFLSSKVGHYSVLTLVSLDVAGIIAAFIISLFKCEKRWGNKGWNEALSALDIASLVFSSLFMLELLLSIWAFGPTYFRSKFHIIDALVVIAGFALDLSLHGGVLEEAASLIVILRLWRVFKIIEELSLGAQEQVEEMEVEIEKLRSENLDLRRAGLSSKRAGEIWRMELESLREERDAVNMQGESLGESPGESRESKKKGKQAIEGYKDAWTEAPEEEVDESTPDEGETKYVEENEDEIEDELDGGDYGERAVGDETEYEERTGQSQGETEPEPKEGILSKVSGVFRKAKSGDDAGEVDKGGETGSGVGREDALALVGEEDEVYEDYEDYEDENGDGDGDGRRRD